MTPTYRKSFVIALTGHVVLIIAVVVASVLPGCQRTKIIDLPVDFMIVPPKTDTPLMRKDPPPEHPVPPPGLPDKVRDPVNPPDIPVKPPDKIPDKVPDKIPDKSPVVKPATNSVPHVATSNTSVHVTVSTNHVIKVIGPQVAGPGVTSHKQQKLSKGEWDRMMGVSAPIGDHDSLPMDERQRCLLLIKQALYDAWNQPAVADAGSRPAELEIRFDLSGRVVGYRITQSSGSDVCDRSVTKAAASVLRVEGLTARFLRDYARLTIDFKLTE